MPLKPLAAKASVFNRNFVDDVASSVATEPDFTEDGFYNDFSKMLGYFYGDIVGLEGASGLRSDQPCRRRVSKGDEFNKAASAPPAPPPAPAAPAPTAGENGARPQTFLPRLLPVRVPKLATAILRPARAPYRARRLQRATAGSPDSGGPPAGPVASQFASSAAALDQGHGR